MNQFSKSECCRRVEALPPYLRDVLRLLADGQPTKQIAANLGVTVPTVWVYRERIYSRLQVNNLATATRVAVVAGLL